MLYEFKEVDAYAFARHVGIRAKQRGHNLHFQTCPYCRSAKDKDTFAIDLETGQFKCLRASCGVSGNMIQLSRDFDFSLGYAVDEYYRPKKRYKRLPTPKEPIIPKDKAVLYLESRAISAEVAKKYEITVHARHVNTLVFPFFDEKGILQMIKYRDTEYFSGKKFIDKDGKERKSPKEWIEENCRPILFGMKQCNDKFDRIVMTEGQLDSLSVATADIENAVSVPNGSQGMTWVPYCFDWVSRFEEIVVFGDFEKGHMTLLDDIRKRFPNKIMHVREQDYRGCKDANELLQKHGKDAVRQAVENAVPAPVNRVLSLAEVESVNIYELPKLKTGISRLDRTLYGGLPFGMVCIIAGKRGDGKSTLASQIMANAVEQDLATFSYSGELPNYLYKSWFDFQVAGRNHIIENQTEYGTVNRFITNKNQELINAWYLDRSYIYDNRIIDSDEKEDLLKSVEQAIMQYGIKVVLIDNLMTAMYIDELQGSDKYDKQGLFVRKLTEIAIRYDVLILLVAHRRKNNFTSDANDEISGSGDITNLAGITLSYDRGSKDEIDKGFMDESQRKLIIAKNRLFGKIDLKGIILNYDEKSKRIYGNGDDVNRQFGWDRSDGFMDANNMEIPFD